MAKDRILLVGAPNSGKTTLFNWLTGRKQKTMNYPGSTVDYATGRLLDTYGESLDIFDSPGTYSLVPKTDEEKVSYELLFSEDFGFRTVVVVVDGTQLPRQVSLIEQLRVSGFQVIVALTMHDLYKKEHKDLKLKDIESQLGVKVIPIDGVLGGGVQNLVDTMRSQQLNPDTLEPPSFSRWNMAHQKQAELVSGRLAKLHWVEELSAQKSTRRLDRILLNPILGFSIFICVMTLLFSSIFWAAAPLMDYVDAAFAMAIDGSRSLLGTGLFADLVTDGIVASVGAVAVFIPQIFILFLGIVALEDSGYLARAATLVDGPLRKVGLEGKSFVPLISGFACAVPAIMAARNVSSPKARWLTVFIIPFMTCSARLPVYALLISFLFLGKSALMAGLFMAGLYFGGLFTGAIASAVLTKVVKVPDQGFFMMELPYYRLPRLRNVFLGAVRRTKAYVVRSGPLIFMFALLIWGMTTFPNYNLEDDAQKLTTSYAGQVGQVIEPVFKPMGADWRVGVGLISAFAAREIFVSALAIVFHVSDTENDEGLRDSLLGKMQEASWADGTPLFTVGSVLALCVFFMLALQCLTTTGVAIQEMGSWRFGLAQLVGMNLLAYLAAILTYQFFGA